MSSTLAHLATLACRVLVTLERVCKEDVMANRRFNQFREALIPGSVDLFAQVTFGASGAPTLSGTAPLPNRGIKSITRLSAGKYTILLQDSYYALLNVTHAFIEASGAPASPSMYISSNAVTTASAPAITVQFNAAGTATDPASGEIALIQIALKNSSA